MVNPTVFSFDFDNTISRDPEGFLGVMEFLEKRGHTVYVVTARLKSVHPEDFEFLLKKGYRVFWTEHKGKEAYMKSIGLPIDVFVDDCPDALLNDYHGQPRTFRDMTEAA